MYGLYYVELLALYTHFVQIFYHEWMLNVVECFFSFYGDDHVVFVFVFVNVVDDADGCWNVVPSLHPWNKSYLIMIDDLFGIFFNLILLSIFAPRFTGALVSNFLFLWGICLVLVLE